MAARILSIKSSTSANRCKIFLNSFSRRILISSVHAMRFDKAISTLSACDRRSLAALVTTASRVPRSATDLWRVASPSWSVSLVKCSQKSGVDWLQKKNVLNHWVLCQSLVLFLLSWLEPCLLSSSFLNMSHATIVGTTRKKTRSYRKLMDYLLDYCYNKIWSYNSDGDPY